MDLREVMARGHGVVRTAQLRQAGIDRTAQRKALRDGLIRPVRHGWYASSEGADEDAVTAVSRGGVLSCVSALAKHGVWIPPGLTERTHYRCNPAVANRGRPVEFCTPYGPLESAVWAVDELPAALRHSLRCLDDEQLIVICDSILNIGALDLDGLRHELRHAPKRRQELLDRCDRAESGTETITRLRLAKRRIKAVPQVEIPGVGRVDFLIGDRLIIEVDGQEFHRDRFEEDRDRDAKATLLGYLSKRFSYRQVIYNWQLCEAVVVALVERGEHLGPLYPGALELADLRRASSR